MARHAIVRNADSKVDNTIELPSGWPSVPNPWTPPANTTVVQSDTAGTGDLFIGGNFIPQPQIPIPDPDWMVRLKTDIDGTNLNAAVKAILKRIARRLS